MEEFLEVVDREGRIISIAPRSLIHGNPSMLHRVVHVLVFNSKGELLLQKRSINKDVAPGKWDTSVGGHVMPGEDLITAVKREIFEEIGITTDKINFLYTYIHSNSYESELVYTYYAIHDGPFSFNQEEIDELAFWKLEEIYRNINLNLFSDNFREEFLRYFITCNQIPFNFNLIENNLISQNSPIRPNLSE